MESTRLHAPAPRPTKPCRPRRTAICAVCQVRQLVRKDGLLAKHRNTWLDSPVRCAGSESTPIPVPVREANFSPAGRHDAKLLDRWDFLTLPMLELLLITRAQVWEVAEPGFSGSIRPMPPGSPWRWRIRMPVGGEVLAHDLTVRALLASVHGVDVSDWLALALPALP